MNNSEPQLSFADSLRKLTADQIIEIKQSFCIEVIKGFQHDCQRQALEHANKCSFKRALPRLLNNQERERCMFFIKNRLEECKFAQLSVEIIDECFLYITVSW